jgi:hypothetical protein
LSRAGKTIHNQAPRALFTLVPAVLYTIIVVILTVIAFFSVDNSAVLIYKLIVHPGVPANLTGIINPRSSRSSGCSRPLPWYFKTKHGDVLGMFVEG